MKPLKVGDVVVDSPVGPGKVTSIDLLGYPAVNKNVVTWLIRAGGERFAAPLLIQKGTDVRN